MHVAASTYASPNGRCTDGLARIDTGLDSAPPASDADWNASRPESEDPMPFKTWIAAASLTLATTVALAQSDVPHREKPAFPGIELPERARGERAVQLLGARLPELSLIHI